jgi:hypothetical protein
METEKKQSVFDFTVDSMIDDICILLKEHHIIFYLLCFCYVFFTFFGLFTMVKDIVNLISNIF